jgi:hypothetical protein
MNRFGGLDKGILKSIDEGKISRHQLLAIVSASLGMFLWVSY